MAARHLNFLSRITLVLLLTSPSFADYLSPVDNESMAQVLSFGTELASSNDEIGFPHLVRVFAFPAVEGECWGPLKSCPDWRLVFTLTYDGLYVEPALYELPVSKGWEFVSWIAPNGSEDVGFVVRTTIPGANLDSEERESWRPVTYEVLVSYDGATYKVTGTDK